MRLYTLKNWAKQIFADDSRPSLETLRARNKKKQIAGGFIDENGRHYVDMDVYDRKHNVTMGLLERHATLSAAPELQGLL